MNGWRPTEIHGHIASGVKPAKSGNVDNGGNGLMEKKHELLYAIMPYFTTIDTMCLFYAHQFCRYFEDSCTSFGSWLDFQSKTPQIQNKGSRYLISIKQSLSNTSVADIFLKHIVRVEVFIQKKVKISISERNTWEQKKIDVCFVSLLCQPPSKKKLASRCSAWFADLRQPANDVITNGAGAPVQKNCGKIRCRVETKHQTWPPSHWKQIDRWCLNQLVFWARESLFLCGYPQTNA